MKGSLKYPMMIAGMVISWSVYYAVSKVVVDATGSPLLAGFFLRCAALLFLTAQVFFDGTIKRILTPGKALPFLLLIGLFGFLLDLFANLGYAHGSLSTGTALLKTDVLMVNLITVILYRQKLFLTDWVGTAVMLFGVLLVLGVDFTGMTFHVTDLFFLLSAASVTANAFIIKSVQSAHGADSDTISYYNNAVVLVLFFCSCLFTAGLPFTASSFSIAPRLLLPLILLGGLAQTGIYFFYYRNLRHFEVWIVKLYLLLMPVLSLLIGVFFLHETLTPQKTAGIAIVLAGAALIVLRSKIHKEAEV
ncbi:MAG: DMT family transporter [Lachnospiraceae bacterium]|nr:DMT family transporter [Lachnospiraceae bacterium]